MSGTIKIPTLKSGRRYDGSALRLRVKRYTGPKVLAIDELGYLRYDNRFADLFL